METDVVEDVCEELELVVWILFHVVVVVVDAVFFDVAARGCCCCCCVR